MVDSNKFRPDLSQFEAIMDTFEYPKPQRITIEPSQSVTPMSDDHFVCSICLFIVSEPKECHSCNKLNCSTCVFDWLKKSDDCPNCRTIYKGGRVNQYVLNALKELDFKCTKCEESFKYKSIAEHKQKCDPTKLDCPLDCGNC